MAVLNSFRLFLLAVVIVVAWFGYNGNYDSQTSPFSTKNRRSPLPDNAVPSSCISQGLVAISFDQGPVIGHTERIVNSLAQTNTKAIFHPVTQYFNNPTVVSILETVKDEGHLIGLTYPVDLDATSQSDDAIAKTLESESKKVFDAVSLYPKYVRMQLGKWNDHVATLLHSNGFQLTTYSIDSMDYAKDATTATVVSQYVDHLASAGKGVGSYVSVHLDAANIYQDQNVFYNIVQTINNYGFKSVRLDACLGDATPYRTNITVSVNSSSSPPPTTEANGSTSGSTIIEVSTALFALTLIAIFAFVF